MKQFHHRDVIQFLPTYHFWMIKSAVGLGNKSVECHRIDIVNKHSNDVLGQLDKGAMTQVLKLGGNIWDRLRNK